MRYGLFLLLNCILIGAQAQGGVDEEEDFAIPPSVALRLDDHASPTPRGIPGALTIRTAELRQMLQAPLEERPLLLDVLGGDGHLSLPGAIWIPDAGRGSSFEDALQSHLARFLELATRGDRHRALVFFCSGPRCWLSYNAALRASRLGYSAVRWYRGGIQAWGAGGGALVKPRVMWQRPPEAG